MRSHELCLLTTFFPTAFLKVIKKKNLWEYSCWGWGEKIQTCCHSISGENAIDDHTFYQDCSASVKLMDNIHESKATAEEVFIIPVRMVSVRLNEAEIILSLILWYPAHILCSLNTPCRMYCVIPFGWLRRLSKRTKRQDNSWIQSTVNSGPAESVCRKRLYGKNWSDTCALKGKYMVTGFTEPGI